MKILKIDYQSPDAGPRLVESFKNTGFAVIVNHNIPKELIQGVYQEWQQFFALPNKMKYKFDPSQTRQSGFFPFKSENAKDNQIKDLKEFFHIFKPDGYPTEVNMDNTKKLKIMLDEMGDVLLTLIEKSTPSSVFQSKESLVSMVNPSNENLLRILHYPPLLNTIEKGAVRAYQHTDINLITLLPAATQSGLQVKDTNDQWHNVDSDFGNIIVNVGDMLELASNYYFKSTTHQVVNPSGEESKKPRYSIPLFISPRNDVKLSPTKTAAEYLDERLREIGLKK